MKLSLKKILKEENENLKKAAETIKATYFEITGGEPKRPVYIAQLRDALPKSVRHFKKDVALELVRNYNAVLYPEDNPRNLQEFPALDELAVDFSGERKHIIKFEH